jgi:uncharacterized protein
MALILDTGPLYASLDRDDADHHACRLLIDTSLEPIVVPAPVLVEVDYLVHTRMHAAVLAVVERLNEPKLATLDHRHFGMLRPRHVDALRLLPE